MSLKLGRYQLLTRIASGGMADVYKAALTGIEGFEKHFAVKKILPHWSKNREFVDMLIDEARTLLHLNHANIVSVFELGLENDTYYLVMEYVDGVDLKRFLLQGGANLPLNAIVFIIREIARGLQYAHDKRDKKRRPLKIVHRDISPHNILLSYEGDVKITDFGIAKVRGKTHETVQGTLKGKFSYMSPEQAMGDAVDHRTDLFALGIILFEMLTGERCFKGQTDLETLEAVRQAKITFPKKAEARIPPELRTLLMGLLQKDRQARYQSAAQVVDDLLRLELVLGLSGGKDALIKILKSKFAEHPDAESTVVDEPGTKIQTSTQPGEPPAPQIRNKTKILVSRTLLMDEAKEAATVPAPQTASKWHIPWARLVFFGVVILGAALTGAWMIRMGAEPPAKKVSSPTQGPIAPAESVPEPRPVPEDPPPADAPTHTTHYKITAQPSDATIRVRFDADKSLATQGEQTQDFTLAEDKEFFVSVERAGYIPETFRFSLGPRQNEFLREVVLSKSGAGTLTVTAKPWARVSVPGLVSGADTPFTRKSIPPGEYTVKVFYPPLKKTVAKTVRIEENSTIRCQAEFSGKPALTCD